MQILPESSIMTFLVEFVFLKGKVKPKFKLNFDAQNSGR